jgi:hypothetical protein
MAKGYYNHDILTDKSLHGLGEKIERLLNLGWCDCHEFQILTIQKIDGLYVCFVFCRCGCHEPDYILG